MIDRLLRLTGRYRHPSLDVHQWGPGAFGGGWYATNCERCGHFAIGNASTRRDRYARLWPSRYSCDATRNRYNRTATRVSRGVRWFIERF